MNAVITPQTNTDWIEALPDPGLLVDPVRDTVEAANSHLARMLGRSVDDLLAVRVTTLFGGQIPQLVSLTDGHDPWRGLES